MIQSLALSLMNLPLTGGETGLMRWPITLKVAWNQLQSVMANNLWKINPIFPSPSSKGFGIM